MQNSLTQTIYLESYVESTVFLPTELQRILSIIKSLDVRCMELKAALAFHTTRLMALPPQHATAAAAAASGGTPNTGTSEYATLMHRVEVDHRLLAQFAEEKVSGHGLLGRGWDDAVLHKWAIGCWCSLQRKRCAALAC
ncbi:hypothetical protein DUNSADRAFT_1905 [Dunaliella salina]|uniref:Uncharacterized protein n=1 Tax=Dunaliella salina TaxID=3046 RepID=A0ABQ7GWI8_DUNSA|nr:hypothetical protein DUNSADRAFT_1905 [Dunaliella salina]|eukprot:KAF5838960.1 hypothetical protein DUNSADRAFT_1905 [Dunaliella salina]